MKILFVIGELGYIDPVGIAFLSAVAKRRGHATSFCACDRDDLVERIAQLRPELVAYSAYTADIERFAALNQRARTRHDFVAVIGGPHATFAPQETLARGFEACVIGEGEETFDELLARVESGASYDDVEGLITPRQQVTRIRALNQDLDTLPMPDRDLVLSATPLGATSKKTFFSSRGCPFQCSYCLNPALQKLYRGRGKYVRRFSVDRVLEEIQSIRARYRLDFVKFDDDVFALKPDAWMREFAEKYPREVGLPFNCLVHLDNLPEDLVVLLEEAGCHSVTTSIDSASKTIRKQVVNRRISDEQAISSLRRLERHGIKSFVNFIIDLPGATVADELASIELARQARVTYLSYTFLTLFPGTNLRRQCLESGFIDEGYEAPARMLDEPMLCTSPEEKRIKQNLLDLGHIAMESSEGVKRALVELIKTAPHSSAFSKLRQDTHRYYMENIIYRCQDGLDLQAAPLSVPGQAAASETASVSV